jgi:hypothetical protein
MAESKPSRWAPRGETTQQSQQLEWCVKAPPKNLSFLGTNYDTVAGALTETFGPFPIQLNKFEHELVLKAMGAAAGVGSASYKQLLEALNTHGEIEIRQA